MSASASSEAAFLEAFHTLGAIGRRSRVGSDGGYTGRVGQDTGGGSGSSRAKWGDIGHRQILGLEAREQLALVRASRLAASLRADPGTGTGSRVSGRVGRSVPPRPSQDFDP